jgi:hypothetical protein
MYMYIYIYIYMYIHNRVPYSEYWDGLAVSQPSTI